MIRDLHDLFSLFKYTAKEKAVDNICSSIEKWNCLLELRIPLTLIMQSELLSPELLSQNSLLHRRGRFTFWHYCCGLTVGSALESTSIDLVLPGGVICPRADGVSPAWDLC